jgi:flagellar hook assembly protein FlgD
VSSLSNISLKIYDMLGKEIISLVDKKQSKGTYSVEWNGSDSNGNCVNSGVYFIRLKDSKGHAMTRKMFFNK